MKTEEKLKEARPVLSREKREALWSSIEGSIQGIPRTSVPVRASHPVVSPYRAFLRTRVGATLSLFLVLVVSTSSIAFASEPARPGDLLFPIDRAIEDARLTLAGSLGSRDELLLEIGDERLRELRSIIGEETEERDRDDSVTVLIEAELRTLEVEVDVFTDTTVIEIELNGERTYLTTGARSREDIVTFIREHFPILSLEVIYTALNFEIEDRASRPQDRGEVALKESGRARVDEALKISLPLLTQSNADIDDLIGRLADEVRGLDIEIDDDEFRVREGKNRYEWKDYDNDDDDEESVDRDDDDVSDERREIRNENERIRIEEKEGEVRVRIDGEEEARYIQSEYEYADTRDDDDSDDENDGDSSDDDSQDNDDRDDSQDERSDDEVSYSSEDSENEEDDSSRTESGEEDEDEEDEEDAEDSSDGGNGDEEDEEDEEENEDVEG